MKEKGKRLRAQSLGEEIGNAITHGVAFLLGLFGYILLLIKADTSIEYVAVTIFGIGMMMLYLSSCLYHAFKNGSKIKNIFKRFDHLSIYLLIGGTFAPILLSDITGTLGKIFFVIQWSVIFIGVLLKSFNTSKFHVLHVILYLVLGWCGLMFIPSLYKSAPQLFWLILLGGLTYSIGVFFYAARFKYAHFVWHFFCMLGTALQFFAIYFYIL